MGFAMLGRERERERERETERDRERDMNRQTDGRTDGRTDRRRTEGKTERAHRDRECTHCKIIHSRACKDVEWGCFVDAPSKNGCCE